MTEVATVPRPIPLDQSDIAWLEARHPRSVIDELFADGEFVIVDEQKVVSENVRSKNRN